ncbi:TPA: hypothetical protein MH565_24535 [Klebsiella pneumoniae]|uniref:Small membrane protein n=1 Tax=Klebsiella pneumoniae TaxID=573 RepID=A0A9Q7GPX6_KLEPN|nr:hypothetical protein BB788_26755 [Klebsiella pneumoniae]ARV43310.1 hypothetical protein RJA_29845 [Klebsiella pneumoniae subsp. pneumoniae]MDR8273831.1 small membrane protein [Acinetobacter baumannii]QAA75429.1 hypothetical protein D4N21_28745 [Klebsiella variicola]TYC69855.1 small membrane protein [Klebsiella sp. Z2]
MKREEEVNYPSIIFIILFLFYLSIYNFYSYIAQRRRLRNIFLSRRRRRKKNNHHKTSHTQ